jgi:geranylgeranyl pyrophosphate synthase
MREDVFLGLVEERLADLARPLTDTLDRSAGEIGLRAGGRARPRLVRACAEVVGLSPESASAWAALIETIHLASLMHDDVIDGARLRRGKPALCHREGNRRAVLAGDLLVSAAWLRAAELPPAVTAILARAMLQMSRAELREAELLWNPDATVALYLDIVDGKTAALFAAAAEGTAALAKAGDSVRQALAAFGGSVGRAFQIRDDVRDYALPPRDSGKDARKDLAQGLVTLPLILALRRDGPASSRLRRHLCDRGRSPLEAHVVDGLILESSSLARSLRLAGRQLREGLRRLERSVPIDPIRPLVAALRGPSPGPIAIPA